MEKTKRTPLNLYLIIYFILILAGASLLFYLPHSLVLKIILVAFSILAGVMSKPAHSGSEDKAVEGEKKFYLKSRELGVSKFALIFVLSGSYWTLHQYAVSFVFVMVLIILLVSLLIEYFFESEYPKQYIIAGDDYIKKEMPERVNVNLCKVKYVKLDKGHVILYEDWQHHKIVFNKFEEGEMLKEWLLQKINGLNIEWRKTPVPDAGQNDNASSGR